MRIWRSWEQLVSEMSAILTLAHRDLIKLLRDRARLREELARLELRSDGDGPFRVHVDSRHTHEALKAIQTPLTLVRTHMPSLEDAYLEIVGTVSE